MRWVDRSLQQSARPWGAPVGFPSPTKSLQRPAVQCGGRRCDPCRHSSCVCIQSAGSSLAVPGAAGGGSVPQEAPCGRQKPTAPGPPSERRRQHDPLTAVAWG